MKPVQYQALCDWLEAQTGIHLDSSKEYLVLSRLKPLCERLGFDSVATLIDDLFNSNSFDLERQVIDAMVTTETSFFRDQHPFNALRHTVLPRLIKARNNSKSLRIWCAAAASGQEPYSIALTIREYFPELLGWDIRILATDLSDAMLDRCRRGTFGQHEVNRGMPTMFLLRYFRQTGSQWQIADDIRTMVEFRKMNLVHSWPALGPFDVVFLRNVMIYFEVPTKRVILQRLERVLQPDGYLMLGGAETTLHINENFRRVDHVNAALFQKVSISTR